MDLRWKNHAGPDHAISSAVTSTKLLSMLRQPQEQQQKEGEMRCFLYFPFLLSSLVTVHRAAL